MRTYEPHPHKIGCHDAKPARIVLRTGEILDATHHFRTDDAWVCVYENSRSDGIAKKIPSSNIKWIDFDKGVQ